MNKNIIVTVVVLAIILIGGWIILRGGSDVTTDPDESSAVQSETPAPGEENVSEMIVAENASENVVTYTQSGFSPSELTIKKGETVVFTNEGGGAMWVASAQHPTHKSYPGSDVNLCGSSQEAGIFDQCGTGDQFEFTFDQVGTWGYHNHRQASHFGKIIVE